MPEVIDQLKALGAKKVMLGGSEALGLKGNDTDIFVAAVNIPAVRDKVLENIEGTRMDKRSFAYETSPFTSIRLGRTNILVCSYDYFEKVEKSIDILKYMRSLGVNVASKNVRIAVHEMVRGDY